MKTISALLLAATMSLLLLKAEAYAGEGNFNDQAKGKDSEKSPNNPGALHCCSISYSCIHRCNCSKHDGAPGGQQDNQARPRYQSWPARRTAVSRARSLSALCSTWSCPGSRSTKTNRCSGSDRRARTTASPPLRPIGMLSLERFQRRPGALQPFRRAFQRGARFRGIELSLCIAELPRPKLNLIHAAILHCAARTEVGSGSTARKWALMACGRFQPAINSTDADDYEANGARRRTPAMPP
jgi:hypothetical protein